MEPFLQSVVGAIVWTIANVVYVDLRRKGVRGFGRFTAFWVGNPATWITLFVVKEGQVVLVQPAADDDDRLLREIRVDRELRSLGAPRVIDGDAGSAATPRAD